MKLKELKELNNEELKQKEKSLKKELFDMNYQRRMGTVEKPHQFKLIHRTIARILTIIKERDSQDEAGTKSGK